MSAPDQAPKPASRRLANALQTSSLLSLFWFVLIPFLMGRDGPWVAGMVFLTALVHFGATLLIAASVEREVVALAEDPEHLQARELTLWSRASWLHVAANAGGSALGFVMVPALLFIGSGLLLLAQTSVAHGLKELGDESSLSAWFMAIVAGGMALGAFEAARQTALFACRGADDAEQERKLVRHAVHAREIQGGALSLDQGVSSGGDLALVRAAGDLTMHQEASLHDEAVVFDLDASPQHAQVVEVEAHATATQRSSST